MNHLAAPCVKYFKISVSSPPTFQIRTEPYYLILLKIPFNKNVNFEMQGFRKQPPSPI